MISTRVLAIIFGIDPQKPMNKIKDKCFYLNAIIEQGNKC